MKPRYAAAVTAVLLSAVPAFAARPMTIADLLGAVRVSEPQLSPDGRTVVFVRTITDVPTGTSQTVEAKLQ